MTNLSDLTPGGGGGAGIDFQEFTTNGTWTKPDDVSWVKIEVIGGGGGGGSGRVGGNANGGNGGGGSPILTGIWAASDVPDSATITIGAGGTGGAAQTADSTDGNSGTDGGTSSFGTFFAPDIYGIGGGYGRNYATYNRFSPIGVAWPPHIRGSIANSSGGTQQTAGLGGQGTNNQGDFRNTSNDAAYEGRTASTSSAKATCCAGGGGGGGVVNGAATYTAGMNGGFGQERESTWVSWTTAITEGRNGNNAPTGSTAGGMGGTGNRTGNGGNGGNGGIGSGGGGGAGVPDTYDSGAGGNGGGGRIRVWAW